MAYYGSLMICLGLRKSGFGIYEFVFELKFLVFFFFFVFVSQENFRFMGLLEIDLFTSFMGLIC